MKKYLCAIILAISPLAASADTGSTANQTNETDCFRAGACGADGLDGPGWSRINKESSGCGATATGEQAYDKGVSQFSRIDSRSSSATTLMSRYQRLCANR